MLDENADISIIRVTPANNIPLPEVIDRFAREVGYEQWYAIVFDGHFIIVTKIEGPLS